ncbi:MAG: hypothetical protein ACETWD_00480 [Desulfatiglandales bacterium]
MVTSLEKWQSIIQDPRVVHFFTDIFERLGVRVTDTKEQFTCIHRGDRIDFEPTLDEKKVDYTVEIQSYQVDRLAEHAKTGEFGIAEQYRIVRALFTPATSATLKSPIQSSSIVRALSGVEDLIHVYLMSPTPEEPDCEDTNHTLIYVKGQWLVIPGLHGRPRRTFRLTMEDALIYQRKIFTALKANRWLSWWKFLRWYLRWRKAVSTRP